MANPPIPRNSETNAIMCNSRRSVCPQPVNTRRSDCPQPDNHLPTGRPFRGFSLLELMIVLVVMVGLLAIAWPNMQRSLRRNTLNEAAQVLREAIDEGRYEAITTGQPIFVQMQQGNHEVRTGSFANFANAEDADSSLSTSLSGTSLNQSTAPANSSTTSQQGFGLKQKEEKAPRSWRLPESIVITEVSWTSDSITQGNDEENAASNSHSTTIDASSAASEYGETALASGLTESETAIAELGATHHDWWLPISATGQSKNASIVLYDTSIHETMTVTYASATGALEIVR